MGIPWRLLSRPLMILHQHQGDKGPPVPMFMYIFHYKGTPHVGHHALKISWPNYSYGKDRASLRVLQGVFLFRYVLNLNRYFQQDSTSLPKTNFWDIPQNRPIHLYQLGKKLYNQLTAHEAIIETTDARLTIHGNPTPGKIIQWYHTHSLVGVNLQWNFHSKRPR